MKNIILSLVVILEFSFGYMTVNDIVGVVIDAREAKYYRIFTDVPGFESARFCENGDSILVELNTAIDSVHDTQYRIIDKKIFTALVDYIRDFERIVEEPAYRNIYINKHLIGWPLISQNEIDAEILLRNNKRIQDIFCCMSCIIPGSASIGSCLGQTVIETYYGDCASYSIYKINPYIFGAVTATGTGGGYLLASSFNRVNVYDRLLKKGILAFDSYQQPITVEDCEIMENMTNQFIFGCTGLVISSIATIVTFAFIATPFLGNKPNTVWDGLMAWVPIASFSFSELITITKFGVDLGKKQDRKATIERIKQKRIKEHLEKTKR